MLKEDGVADSLWEQLAATRAFCASATATVTGTLMSDGCERDSLCHVIDLVTTLTELASKDVVSSVNVLWTVVLGALQTLSEWPGWVSDVVTVGLKSLTVSMTLLMDALPEDVLLTRVVLEAPKVYALIRKFWLYNKLIVENNSLITLKFIRAFCLLRASLLAAAGGSDMDADAPSHDLATVILILQAVIGRDVLRASGPVVSSGAAFLPFRDAVDALLLWLCRANMDDSRSMGNPTLEPLSVSSGAMLSFYTSESVMTHALPRSWPLTRVLSVRPCRRAEREMLTYVRINTATPQHLVHKTFYRKTVHV
jgi:hypothetical protein